MDEKNRRGEDNNSNNQQQQKLSAQHNIEVNVDGISKPYNIISCRVYINNSVSNRAVDFTQFSGVLRITASTFDSFVQHSSIWTDQKQSLRNSSRCSWRMRRPNRAQKDPRSSNSVFVDGLWLCRRLRPNWVPGGGRWGRGGGGVVKNWKSRRVQYGQRWAVAIDEMNPCSCVERKKKMS